MLTRLRFKGSHRFVVRCLSDKAKDGNSEELETKPEKQSPNNTTSSAKSSNTEKIQALLKSMVQENKMRENEYATKFATAPGIFKKRKPKADEIEVKEEQIEESITTAAADVAQALGGDVKQTESELLSKVLGKVTQSPTSLSDLILGMKVDRTKEAEDELKMETRGQQVKRLVDKSKADSQQRTRYGQRRDQAQAPWRESARSMTQSTQVDVFSEEPLGIFPRAETPNYGTRLETWEALQQRELQLALTQPPTNYFQKMINWTNQGKVWKFPINNEQGLEDEQNVHFSEHVFLENHLEGWCPRKGPIKHFMELVCVGLSKNPFYTAQEKKDHIMWYKDYFESKKNILSEVGALDVAPKSDKPSM